MMKKKAQTTSGADYVTLSYVDRYPMCESIFPSARDPHKELKPCPFCGGKAYMRVRGDNTMQKFHSAFFAFGGYVFEGWIYCKNCGAFMHTSFDVADDVNDWIDWLANKWNRRAYFVDLQSAKSERALPERKPCPCCGGTRFWQHGSPEYDNRFRKTGKHTNYAVCPDCNLETALVIADTPERADEIANELWNARYIETES